jgi:hypothetical protein
VRFFAKKNFIAESYFLRLFIPYKQGALKKLWPEKIIHDHKLTTFAYFTGKMQLLWVFDELQKKTHKNHLCMIV